MTPASRILTAVTLLTMAVPAAAQEGTPVDPATLDAVSRMNMAVNTVALDRLEEMLEPGERLRVLVVAQQQALSLSCDGYDLDNDRYRAVLPDIVAPLQALTDDGAENLPVDIVLNAYSLSLGGQIAVAAYDTEAYCARGEELRAELAEDTEGRLNVLKPVSE